MAEMIEIIGLPIDLGQSQRGVDLGPGALRHAGLAMHLEQLGKTVVDRGNIRVPVRESIPGQKDLHYLPAIIAACSDLYSVGKDIVAAGHCPIFLGGDHSLAIGSVAAMTEEAGVGLLWIDAHSDFHTPQSSRSRNVHGMALAALLGHGPRELVDLGRPGAKLEPVDVVILGLRETDPGEKKRLLQSGVAVYTMRDLDEKGMSLVAREALQRLEHRERLHVSFDLDAIDPMYAPGVGTAVGGGISSREGHLLMEIIADSGRLAGLDIVEINPILDHHNQTAKFAVALAATVFGKRIL